MDSKIVNNIVTYANFQKQKGLVGLRSGRLLMLEEIPKEQRRKPNKAELLCLCDCGVTKIITRDNFVSENSLSCGCLAIELAHQKSIEKVIGKRFGRLVVIREADDSQLRKVRVLCLCDCGICKSISLGDLRAGMIRSCGCLRIETLKAQAEDLTGQTFYELTAIRQVENHVGSTGLQRVQWLWQCTCGKQIVAMPMNVKRGMTKSCGHIGKSLAEYKIHNFLTENNISFKYNEELFEDCVNPDTGHPLNFDFAIMCPNGIEVVIEHQGEQHFYTKGARARNGFGKLQREVTDKIKKEYCSGHNIKLYETKFDEDYVAHVQSILEENGFVFEKAV